MTTQETAKKIKSLIKKDFGKSFSELKKEITESRLKQPLHLQVSSDIFKSNNGYSIFYTSNTNFKGGSKNGGGAGFFARVYGCGIVRDIKLSK